LPTHNTHCRSVNEENHAFLDLLLLQSICYEAHRIDAESCKRDSPNTLNAPSA